jgi:hypothetical protein
MQCSCNRRGIDQRFGRSYLERMRLPQQATMEDRVKNAREMSRVGGFLVAAAMSVAILSGLMGAAHPAQAALIADGKEPQLLIGSDEDRQDNAPLQAGAAANQSLNRTDVISAGPGDDVIFGLNGNDVIDGGPGADIILGGPDGGAAPGGPPNSDIMFGGPGDDVNLWAPGDGSEVFLGGPGRDALVFGTTDREAVADPATGVRLPTLLFGVGGFPQGIPTANVSGQSNFCTIEDSPLPAYRYLVRFRSAAGSIIVTVRVADVEQVFCSQGGSITFADLSVPSPTFAAVSQSQVQALNPLVGAMIR